MKTSMLEEARGFGPSQLFNIYPSHNTSFPTMFASFLNFVILDTCQNYDVFSELISHETTNAMPYIRSSI